MPTRSLGAGKRAARQACGPRPKATFTDVGPVSQHAGGIGDVTAAGVHDGLDVDVGVGSRLEIDRAAAGYSRPNFVRGTVSRKFAEERRR